MLLIAAATLAFVWLLQFLLSEMRKPKNFPRGPFFYPIIGSATSLKRARNECGMLMDGVLKIAEGYPDEKDLLGFKVGKDRIVFTLSTKALLETYANPDLDGRPTGAFFETRTWNMRRGIVMVDEEFFTVQKRFVVRQLKEFGFARTGMKEICEAEAEYCLNDLRKRIDEAGGKCIKVTMPNIHETYILNTLWKFMAGIRYNPDNAELKQLHKFLDEVFKSCDMTGATFSHFPILRFIAPELSGYNNFVKSHNNFHKFLRKEVENHKRNFNPTDEPKDLIEAYLRILYSGDEESGQVHESFSELQLLAICLDMFMAGSETTSKTIDFMFLYLIRNPSIQKKARKEIDAVVGRNRLPRLEDRVNLPYCDAVVNEAIRIFARNTCGIPHRALKDTKLCGRDIPKDTWIVQMYAAYMEDEKIYKHPIGFHPENFLNEKGEFVAVEKHYPFGLGRRRCLGEVLAKSNAFLIFTTLIQNFFFEVPVGHDLPSDKPVDGITGSVRDYEALIIRRN